jgi:hypothetical protein
VPPATSNISSIVSTRIADSSLLIRTVLRYRAGKLQDSQPACTSPAAHRLQDCALHAY